MFSWAGLKLRSFTALPHTEEKKPVIEDSFALALKHGLLVHLVPVSVAASLIAMNLAGIYFGPSLDYGDWRTPYTLAMFQVIAKVQELFITASLTTIVFHIIRHQLLHGDGLPLALVGSGFTFTKMHFLWSRSIWSGLPNASAMCLRVLILVSLFSIGLVTLVVGPASAVLMLPRQTDQTVWTTNFWLKGSTDDLWPTTLTSAHIGDLSESDRISNSSCSLPTSISNNRCISMAYQKLQALLDSAPNMFHHDWTFIARENTFTRLIGVQEGDGSNGPETWTSAPHVATAYVQDQLWWDSSWFLRFNDRNGRLSNVVSKSAGVRTVCWWQAIRPNTSELTLATLQEYESYTYNRKTVVSVPPSLWSNDSQTFIDPDIVRTIWLPREAIENIGSVTAGLVIMAPTMSSNYSFRSALGCAIDARWIDSQSTQADGEWDIAVTANALHRRKQSPGLKYYGFLPVEGSWSKIIATSDWLQALTPAVPDLSRELLLNAPAPTLANLLMNTNHAEIIPIYSFSNGYLDQPYIFWEFVVSTLFADGVARIGYAQQLASNKTYVNNSRFTFTSCTEEACTWSCKDGWGSGAPNMPNICGGPPPTDGNYTEMSFRGDLTGIYAYRASAKTDYASIAILSIYIFIATSHFCYNLIRRRSSQAWEKLEDLLALVHSSCPAPEVLGNTCAGVRQSETKMQNMRVVVVGANAGEEEQQQEEGEEEDDGCKMQQGGEEVQIVFVNDAGAGRTFGPVQANVKYGKME